MNKGFVYLVTKHIMHYGNLSDSLGIVDIYSSKEDAKSFVEKRMKSNNRTYIYKYTKKRVL